MAKAKKAVSRLDRFLKDSRNSVFKEKLVNYRFFYDVKLAAARKGQDIRIFIPEIDKDGYDVVLDDGDKIKPFQLKATCQSSATSQWEVQKSLLRPHHYNCKPLGYEESPQGEGVEGGFILINLRIKNDDIESLEYYYTDTYILKAFEVGLLRYNNKSYEQKICSLIERLYNGKKQEKIRLTKSNLVQVRSVDHLLALANFPSKYENQWQASFLNFYRNQGSKISVVEERKELVEILNSLIDDKNIKIQ